MIFQILLTFFFVGVSSQWELIYDDLSEVSFDLPTINSQWKAKAKTTQNLDRLDNQNVKTCQNNDKESLKLDPNQDALIFYQELNKPYYNVLLYLDIYFQGKNEQQTKQSSIIFNNNNIYTDNYIPKDFKKYQDVCNNRFSGFEQKTLFKIITPISNITYLNLTFNQGEGELSYRDLQIFAKPCHYSCLTCFGGLNNQCLTCYYGGQSTGICPLCPENFQFIDISKQQCIQECNRSGSLNNGSYFSKHISPLAQHFANNTFTQIVPFTKIQDSHFSKTNQLNYFNLTACTLIQPTYQRFFGLLKYNEGVQLIMQLAQNIIFLRLRVTFYYNNWEDYSNIQLSANGNTISKLQMHYNYLTLEGQTLIASYNTCQLIRTETLINITNSTVILKMFGNMSPTKTPEQTWGFNNITIDKATCSQNCTKCNQQYQCTQCENGFFIYRGQCLKVCPPYSKELTGICEDFEDLINNSKYLIKGFYDRKQQIDELNDLVGDFTSQGTNFETTIDQRIIFSYLPDKRILGGPLVWNRGYFSKQLNSLEPHFQIQLYMTVILGENMAGNFFYIIDNKNNTLNKSLFWKQNIAGTSNQEVIVKISQNISHNLQNLTIKLHCYAIPEKLVDGFCGVYDYFICFPYCVKCSGPKEQDCQKWPENLLPEVQQFNSTFQCQKNYSLNTEVKPAKCQSCNKIGCLACSSQITCTECNQYSNFTPDNGNCLCKEKFYLNGDTCNPCHTACKTCFGPNINQCLSCSEQDYRYLDVTICSCLSGYEDIADRCTKNCSQIQTIMNDECYKETDYKIQFKGCIKCSYKCDDQCNSCLSKGCQQCDEQSKFYLNNETCIECSDTQFYDQINLKCSQCQNQCKTCIYDANTCLSCNDNYQLNNQTAECIPCTNLEYFDGATRTCQACVSPCFSCLDKQECTTCIDGYYKTIERKCAVCSETCKTCEENSQQCLSCFSEDFIYDRNDKICTCAIGYFQLIQECVKCQQPCLTCIIDSQYCTDCIDGYYQSQQFTCEQCIQPCKTCIEIAYNCLSCVSNLYQLLNGQCQCQNGYVEIDYECIKCQLPCIQCFNSIDHCQECLDDKQQLNQQYQCECFKGYIMNQQYKCELIPIIEIIDDQNQDNNQEISQINIELLQQSQLVCGDNSILYNNQCISQCGNGLLNQQYELCDDGNQIGGDGCSEICEIEEQFKCNNQQNQLSQCQFIQNLNFNLQLISQQKDQLQIVQLNFNQQIKLIQDIQLNDCISIIIIPQTSKYQLTYTSINQPNNLTYQNVIYQINVNFIEQVSNPLMQFNFTINNFINENDLQLKLLYKEISLGNPFILSQNTQAKVNFTIKMNQIMMYTMAGVAGTSLLTGNLVPFFGMLDLYQQLSYLKYTTFQKPPHLEQFLELFSKITLKPLLDFLQIDYYLAKLNGGKLPFIKKTQDKNQSSNISNINAYFIINAKSCYITIIISYLIYLACSILNSKNIFDKLCNMILSKKWTLEKQFDYYKVLNKVRQALQQQKMLYFNSGLLQVIQSIEHQFMFSAFMQFPYYNFDTTFDCFNSLNAIFGVVLPLYLGFTVVNQAKKQNRNILKWNYFFQGIKLEYWTILQKPIQIIKVMFYLGSIVFLKEQPATQSFALSFISGIYCLYLIQFKPYQSVLEQVKNIGREILFLTSTGTFLAYQFQLNDDLFNTLGWIHIGLFSSILGINLLIDLLKQIQEVYKAYQKSVKQDLIKKQKMYKFNKLQEFVAIKSRK